MQVYTYIQYVLKCLHRPTVVLHNLRVTHSMETRPLFSRAVLLQSHGKGLGVRTKQPA